MLAWGTCIQNSIKNNQLLRVGSFMWLDRSRFQEYKSDNHNRIISISTHRSPMKDAHQFKDSYIGGMKV